MASSSASRDSSPSESAARTRLFVYISASHGDTSRNHRRRTVGCQWLRRLSLYHSESLIKAFGISARAAQIEGWHQGIRKSGIDDMTRRDASRRVAYHEASDAPLPTEVRSFGTFPTPRSFTRST
jgi:hypothetical protein